MHWHNPHGLFSNENYSVAIVCCGSTKSHSSAKHTWTWTACWMRAHTISKPVIVTMIPLLFATGIDHKHMIALWEPFFSANGNKCGLVTSDVIMTSQHLFSQKTGDDVLFIHSLRGNDWDSQVNAVIYCNYVLNTDKRQCFQPTTWYTDKFRMKTESSFKKKPASICHVKNM